MVSEPPGTDAGNAFEVPSPEWTSSDAWILASLNDLSCRGDSVRTLIGSADAHNHAIPSYEELAEALGALMAAGLVQVAPRGFRTTRAGRRLKRHWRGGMFEWGVLLPLLREFPKAPLPHPISRSEYETALRDYLKT